MQGHSTDNFQPAEKFRFFFLKEYVLSEDVVSIDCNKDFSWFCNSQFWCSLRNKQSIIIIIMIIIILINNYNYSPKSRWLVVDIIRVTIFQVSPKFYHGYEIKTTNLNATFWGIRKDWNGCIKTKRKKHATTGRTERPNLCLLYQSQWPFKFHPPCFVVQEFKEKYWYLKLLLPF